MLPYNSEGLLLRLQLWRCFTPSIGEICCASSCLWPCIHCSSENLSEHQARFVSHSPSKVSVQQMVHRGLKPCAKSRLTKQNSRELNIPGSLWVAVSSKHQSLFLKKNKTVLLFPVFLTVQKFEDVQILNKSDCNFVYWLFFQRYCINRCHRFIALYTQNKIARWIHPLSLLSRKKHVGFFSVSLEYLCFIWLIDSFPLQSN